ncbi:MAG: 2-hydroxyacyl-CoA dehydratase [Deltaproteobacteria bacterium]|nr:2-hydroxyacyl-CoA dehydratase [Deltaproteobacteria bacterium]
MASIFQDWMENRHERVRNWKAENGRKAYGYLCCMTPEEILYAGGILPVKVTGSGAQPLEVVDKHVVHYACPYVRSMLDAAGRGDYNYLDGIVVCNSCDIMSRCEYYWRVLSPHQKPTILGVELSPYVLYIKSPEKISGPGVHEYLLGEFRIFKQHIERETRELITDEKLSQAIAVYNEHYDWMQRMHALRKDKSLKISGSEAFTVEFTALQMPKDEHNRRMAAFLEEVENREPLSDRVRIFLSGGAVDQFTSRIYSVIEEAGGNVVAEDIGVGASYFGHKIDTSVSPMDAIVKHRLDVHCPHTMTSDYHPRERLDYIKNKLEGADVQGAIFFVPMYCECRNLEYPFLKEKFKEELGIPSLYLESDYGQGSLDEAVSKVEAFIEMLEG